MRILQPGSGYNPKTFRQTNVVVLPSCQGLDDFQTFDAMVSADFQDGPSLNGDEESEPIKMLVGMNSSEKEKVKFSAPVATAPKSVEFWMLDLEDMMMS